MASDLGAPRVLPCGDSAIAVEFGDSVDPRLQERVLGMDRELAEARLPGVIEAVPTYRSLLVHFDPLRVDPEALARVLQEMACRAPRPPRRQPVRWQVPVVYGGAHGEDLETLAAEKGMSPAAFVDLHSARVYVVCMIGFMPGYTYLGGLDPRLAAPRLAEPRTCMPAGSVAIGGVQTSIGSMESPSGWRLIGRTPVRCFQPGRKPTFLFEPGHQIVFEPVAAAAWNALESEAEALRPVAKRVEQA